MGTNVLDPYDFRDVLDLDNEAVLIAANIENNPVAPNKANNTEKPPDDLRCSL